MLALGGKTRLQLEKSTLADPRLTLHTLPPCAPKRRLKPGPVGMGLTLTASGAELC